MAMQFLIGRSSGNNLLKFVKESIKIKMKKIRLKHDQQQISKGPEHWFPDPSESCCTALSACTGRYDILASLLQTYIQKHSLFHSGNRSI